MSEPIINLNFGITTYKRPNSLKILLEHLSLIETSNNILIKILVVDNDANESARFTVEKYQNSGKWPIQYLTQPLQNISLARNGVLNASTGDYIYFIDDDEYPATDCVMTMIKVAMQYNADIVFGPVLPVYLPETPMWVKKSGLLNHEEHKTGMIRRYGATGNTLIRTLFLETSKLEFNPDFGLSGGEDLEYFSRCAQYGAKMVWCNEARVYEPVAKERLKLWWLLKRSFSKGQRYAKVKYNSFTFIQKLLIFLKRICYLLISIIYLLVSLFLGQAVIAKALGKTFSCLGQLSGFFQWSYKIYHDQ